jgi:8-amino-7-oxononanoate synthase
LPHVLATIHTCGKALASAGAFVCGPTVMKDYLVNHARTFIFSTALPPYFADQIREALHLAIGMDAERQTLLKRASGLNSALRKAGFATDGSTSQIVPVVLGSNEDTVQAAEQLQKAGFAVRAIRPPTVPVGQSRLRLSLTTKIAEEELTRLVKCLLDWREGKSVQMTAKHA